MTSRGQVAPAFAPIAGGWFTMGQALSLPMIAVGIGLLVYAYRRGVPSGNLAVAQ